jgi:hypothetical protein
MMARTRWMAFGFAAALSCGAAMADETRPGDAALQAPAAFDVHSGDVLLAEAVADKPAAAPAAAAPSESRLHTWEMPAVLVEGQKPGELREEDRIGSYDQPRWTAHRRFPTTRAYVIPDGEFETEYWLRATTPQHGSTEFEHRQELEIGLPYRLQLDLYLIERHSKTDGLHFDQAVEVRYAFADWGKLPFNPALYVEFTNQESDPDKVEFKLLLSDELAPRLHYAVNFSYELENSGARSDELEVTAGLAYTVIDERFSLGGELQFAWTTENGQRSTWTEDLRIGPSFQYRPVPSIHIDFAPLFGLTANSSRSDIYLVVGWEF